MTNPKYIVASLGLAVPLFVAGIFVGRTVSAQTQPAAPAAAAGSQDPTASMPDAPGKAITVNTCTKCHAITNITSQHRDADTWTATVTKMVGYGATGTDDDLQQIVDYLTKYYGPASATAASPAASPSATPGAAHAKVMVNKETAVQLATDLGLTDDEAKAVVSYRDKNGDFKSIDDLKKVPNVDATKITAHAADLQFS
jgi:competence protein ComEA